MKIVPVIIIILFFLYVADLQICFVYSTMKKKKDTVDCQHKKFGEERCVAEEYHNTTENIDFLISEEKKDFHNKGISDHIKQLLNGWVMYRVKRLGHVPCQKYRTFILRHIFKMDIAPNAVIYAWDTIRSPWNISIGEGSIIGDEAILDGRNFIKIGRNVNVSTGVCIYTEQHAINDPYFRSLNSGGEVVIEDRAWVSSHSTILPKVHVGEGAVLAAGALTAKSLDAYGVYGGIPAKKIGERTQNLYYEFNGEYLPFI